MRRPDSQLAFQINPKMLSMVDVRALCRPLALILTKLVRLQYVFMEITLSIVILEQKRVFPKLLP